jgi:hypothetical protein
MPITKRARNRRLTLPKVDCHKECACPTPVKAECGCVNHGGGEITFCALHRAAPDLLSALRDLVNVQQSDERAPSEHAAQAVHNAYAARQRARAAILRAEG